jgi:hypothetical protein
MQGRISLLHFGEDNRWQQLLWGSFRLRKRLVLKFSRSRAIIGALDILVDIGVPAEKEVIQ